MKNIRYILSLLILHFCFYINQIIASNVDTTGIKSDNYIRSMTYMNESGSLFTDQITYSDGLGRLFQTIQSRITPTFHDLVTLYTYDGYGRESEVWLPFISSENGKTIAPDYLMAQLKLQYNDTHPYSRTEYELSPLERIVRVVNPGQEWSINDKSLKTEYLLADATSNELKVASFELTTNAKGNPKLSASFIVPFYHGMHRVLRVIDEDNNVSYEFKDAKNQTILVRNIVNGNNVDTYFVYDYSGNLCYVLPPALTDHLLTKIMTAVDASDAQWTSDDPFIYKYAYIYEYDALNRCIAKKLPGCEWIYYVYDKADHLIFSQDGEQRKRGEWEFNIPDVFGRMVLNGLVKTINGGDITVGLFDSHLIEAEFSTSGTYYGYNLKLDGNVLALSVYKILKAAYYDNYAFRGLVGFSNSNLAYKTAGVDDFYLKRYGDDNPATGYKHKNLLTGTFTALLDESNTLLYSCMYYDNEQRLIQTRSINHLPGGLEEEYIAYNFKGQPTRRQHIHSATGKATQTETYAYEYDHAGRLLTTKHRLNAGTEVTLADNEYDELGRLKSNKRNGLSNLASSYTYNIRSWLKSSSSPLFNQTLYYNDTYAGSTARYNGNISAMSWKMSNEIPTRGYKFSYDNLSRLTAANYLENGSANDHFNTAYAYDKQGNMTSLARKGNTGTATYGDIDVLTMTYAGNQLVKAEDTGSSVSLSASMDFKNNSNTTREYSYDANGNLIQDLNKGINSITYNLLNLPQTLTISNPLGSATNSYTYAADGRKLKTMIGGKTTDYCGNVIYENGVLKRILVEGGYIEGGAYYFYLTDHLGNNRVVANASGNIKQTNHYYPFGMSFAEGMQDSSQPYKYNGKELDTDRGLNMYDYSARYMDPALGRFNTMDPMAEKYYSISPYAYCAGNPVRFFDPNGKEIWIYYDDEDGKRQQMLYNANMKYEGDNTFVSASVNYLNSMYSNGGADIMDVLIGSNNSFNMINKTPTDNNGNTLDALQFNETAGGGGDIYAGMLMNSSYSDYVKVEGVSHELFHGFQYEKGQGGASVFNEVEAMVYSSVIANNWLSNNPDYIGALSSNGLGNGSASGNLYEQSFKSLVKDGYSKELFVNTIKTFKTGSNSNASGGYTKIPLMRNNTQVPLLKKYNPKLRK